MNITHKHDERLACRRELTDKLREMFAKCSRPCRTCGLNKRPDRRTDDG
jgi:hypothetical protein